MEQKTLSIVARAKDEASAELRKVQDAVDKTAKQVGGASSDFDKFAKGMDKAGGVMTGAGKTMSLGLTLPIVALGAATVQALQRVEVLGAATDAVITSTGKAANVTREQVEGLATELEKLTGVEAEAVQTGQNMLLTFTNIKNGAGANNDIFDQSTKIMLDMATAMNGGVVPSAEAMKGQAIQLGKALNDPMKGLTALSKVGVSFTQEQKDQIKTMQEAGDTMGAQKVILAELNKEFGGSAEAFGATTAGKVAMLNNQFGELTENLMVGVMPSINALVAKVGELMTKFQAMTPEQQKMVGIGLAIAAAMGPVLIIIGKMFQGISALVKIVQFLGKSWVGTGIKAVAAGIKTGVVWTAQMIKVAAIATAQAARVTAVWLGTQIKMIAGAVAIGAAHVASGVAAAAAWVVANAAMLLGIGLIIAAVAGLVIIIVKNWDTIKAAAVAVWDWIKNAALFVFEAIKTAITFYINAYIQIFQWILQGAQAVWNGIQIAASFVFEVIKQVVTRYINAYIAIFQWIGNAARAVWDGIGNAARWLFNNVIMPVFNGIRNFIGNVFNGVRNIFEGVKNFAVNMFNSIVNGVKSAFGGISGVITSPFKAAFNGIAGLWNNSIGKLSFTAPDWVPGLGGKGFSMPKLPMLATGGIVTGPTQAIIGEGREPEAVLPLSKLDRMLENAGGGNQQDQRVPEINITVQINGTVIGDESSIRNLAVTIGQQIQNQMRAQGTNNVNMLRANT